MINLITGVPGAGKTCYALDFMKQQTKEGRPLFVHGIPELKIPHIDVYCSSPNCDVCSHYTDEDKTKMHQADLWHDWAPDGAVLFFDEVQNVYRPRASGSKVPASIQAFEVHRHRGLDFYLITQSPKLFDSNIRELISRHIHLKSNWSGRYQYEWPECKPNTQSTTDAVKSSYKLNTKMFELYKSASLHTKQSRKMPLAVYVFGIAIVGSLYFGSSVFMRVTGAVLGTDDTKELVSTPTEVKAIDINVKNNTPQKNAAKRQANEQLDFKPRIKGVLESAPAYSGVVKVKDFPRIYACISSSTICTCYTQQMTIYPTRIDVCLSHVNRSYSAFNPYVEPVIESTKGKSTLSN